MNNSRGNMYHLLSRLYKKEVDEKLFNQLVQINFPKEGEDELTLGFKLVADYIDEEKTDLEKTLETLAADFAKVFLGAGVKDANAAFPFESVYTSKKKLVMQEAWEEVRNIYNEHQVVLASKNGEFLEDHIGCELEFMAFLIDEGASNKEQLDFLKEHLTWVKQFAIDVESQADTNFYKGLAKITLGFLKEEKLYLEDECFANSDGVNSYKVSEDEFDEILKELSKDYVICAPKKFMTGAGENAETIKYDKINSLSEIVFDKMSDFSPKESYYPISQTMFYFTESEVIESTLNDDKGILVFARPCDINAMKRLDNIFLNNGKVEDLYYARLRKKVKIVMIECKESFENCFCVSLGTNIADNYDLAMRLEDGIKVQVKNSEFLSFFEQKEKIDFAPEYVKSNKRKVDVPIIKDRDTLLWISKQDFWDQFNEKCIGCGGCNTVCGTCSCFDTVDIIYSEESKEGERKRVWSSCMLEDFTQTAGGARARKTAGENMRFKVMHKFYDYKERFGEENMCVGCGRCVSRCPEDIDFIDTVNGLSELIKKYKEETK